MSQLRQPSSVALVVFGFFAWLLWAGQLSPSAAQAFGSAVAGHPTVTRTPVPSQLGLWVGTPQVVEQRALEILETDDVTAMEYRLGQEPPVWLAQVAGFGTRAAFHPPELCYVGSHFEVLERGPIVVRVNGAERRLMRLVITQSGQRFEAWYWFTAGSRVTSNYYQQQAWLLLDAIRRRPMSGTLVRISTPFNDSEETHRRLLAFVTAWDAASPKRAHHGS